MKKKLTALLLALVLILSVGSALADTYYRVNTSWLKARADASFDAEVLDSYRRDFAVTIAKRYKGGWAKVRFRPSGNTAFVQTKYLKKASASYTAYVNQDKTVMYEGPATSFSSVASFNKGSTVTVLTHGSAFDYVSTSKGKGYIRNTHLTKSKPDGKTAHVKNPANRTVNLRKGPGTGYKVLAEYRPGTKVTVLQYGSEWCKIKVGGRTGYMMTRYIDQN